jgi:lipopolysaccharide biosynthesis glycosyltransferase
MSARPSLDLVLCTDRMHFIGILAALRSIVSNAARPRDLSFHLVVGAEESSELARAIGECFPERELRYRIREFRPSPFLEEYIRAGRELTYAAYTSSVMNFARFYLSELYPELGKYIYLDADLIVRGDVAELFELATLDRHAIAAVPFSTFGTWDGGYDLASPHLRHLDLEAPVFNNGIYVSDLEKWREQGILPALEGWMRIHRQALDEFVFGTQSIMNLGFYRNLEVLPSEWNVNPLGDDETPIPERALEEGKILHWAGRRKPWDPDGPYREHWLPYAPAPLAAGRGTGA